MPRHWAITHAIRDLVAVTRCGMLRWRTADPRNHVIWAKQRLFLHAGILSEVS